MKTKHKIKLLEIAAQVAQDTNGGGKRLSDVRTAFDALHEIIKPPSPDNDIRGKAGASILIFDVVSDNRVVNLCKANGVKTLGDLALKTSSEVALWRGCGRGAFDYLNYVLDQNGLEFGMVDGSPQVPTLRRGQSIRYKISKSVWVTDTIRHIEADCVRLDYTLDGGKVLLFRDYGKLWEVVL